MSALPYVVCGVEKRRISVERISWRLLIPTYFGYRFCSCPVLEASDSPLSTWSLFYNAIQNVLLLITCRAHRTGYANIFMTNFAKPSFTGEHTAAMYLLLESPLGMFSAVNQPRSIAVWIRLSQRGTAPCSCW